MKTMIPAALSLCLAWSANAQLITREGLTGALVGGGLGAVIGHNSGHHSGEGAAIGAGAGFVLGSLFHEPSHDNYAYGYSQPAYGYNTYPGYYTYPVSYSYALPNYAVSGAALGSQYDGGSAGLLPNVSDRNVHSRSPDSSATNAAFRSSSERGIHTIAAKADLHEQRECVIRPLDKFTKSNIVYPSKSKL